MLTKFLISVLFLVSFSHFVSSHADSLNPGVFSKDSSPYGMQYSKWISKWWNWHASIPPHLHPRESNYEPSKCTINQEGEVWFLADGLAKDVEERFCKIPYGKAILVPLLTGIFWDDNPVPQLTDEDLLLRAMEGDEGSELSASIDGLTLKNIQDYRVQTRPFNLTIPENNIFQSKPGTFRAIADGFFVFLEPLSRGTHDLVLNTDVKNPPKPHFNYSARLIYHLQVQ
jgi:hypothetical protein